ncbi:solute carrier family 2 member 11, like [Tachysurus fulvidraco]|uniref:solute carrier family 2 member 11, like n=1 Tax=Tachysurus fulvidraco TaxID=1234273 RepID=UPI000F4DB382|nr:solute carrier family 2 member 11, like [Tachysurus fulvidraco]
MTNAVLSLLKNPVLVAVIWVTGIGGTFQYGFHISVLTAPSAYIKELVNSTCVQRYGLSLEHWQLSLIWSFIVSMYCIGGLLGTLCAGRIAATYGRKKCLMLNNLVVICGAVLMVLSKTARSFEMIMVGRFVYGINAGVGLTVHTMYVLDCAPKSLRGMVGASVGSFVSLGKFFGQLLGLSEIMGTEALWPFLLAFSALTGLLQLVCLYFLPESPRFLLLNQGDKSACEKALHQLRGSNADCRSEVEEMLAECVALQTVRNHSVLELFLARSVRWQLFTIIIAFITLQLCGINAVYLYASDVFRAAGIPAHNLRYVTLGTGLCEFSTSIVCGLVIEHTGKKLLMVWGYVSMSVALLLLTLSLYLQVHVSWMPYCSMVLIFVFIISFCSGPSCITAPLPGELFTQSFQSAAYTVACTLNWMGLFLVGMVFPLIVEHLDYFCFLVFFVFCFCTAVFVWYHVPETRNKSVVEITAEFDRMHNKAKHSETNLKALKDANTQNGKCTRL